MRTRVSTVVITLATLVAVASSSLAATLLVASHAPFEKAFARQHGAHLTVQYAADRTTERELSGTTAAAEAAGAAGPFRTVTAVPDGAEGPPGLEPPPLTLAGRADPGAGDGAVDVITLTEGRWVGAPGEIVLSAQAGVLAPLGRRLTFPELPGSPELTVVGTASSVTDSADGWVVPWQLPEPDGYQVLYRFTDAGTPEQVAAGQEAVTAGLPADAVAGARSWLTVKENAARDTALFVPFVTAFGVLGLVMSALTVGHVVAGAVGSQTRRIGVLKAIGYTPGGIVRQYVARALLPAAIGTALGVVAGRALAVPMLAEAGDLYGTTGTEGAGWVDAAVAGATLTLVALIAWACALRAGRLRTVRALATAPGTGSTRLGRWAARVAGRLPVPAPVALGLTRPPARPVRAAATVIAIVFGTAAVTFTLGLGTTLADVLQARSHDGADVVVGGGPAPFGASAATVPDPAAVAEVIDAQPGTRTAYAVGTLRATVAGLDGTVEVAAFDGDASWDDYRMLAGRWPAGAGEAAVPTMFLTATGTAIGDSITVGGSGGAAVSVRIVGEVFDLRLDGKTVFTDAATLAGSGLAPDPATVSHHIALRDGVPAGDYLDALNTALEPLGTTARAGGESGSSGQVLALNTLSAVLTLMLVAVAALGVLNSVALDTHDRARELGIHKALGMVPRQIIAMVLTSVVLTGLVGGALGVPLGVALHGWVLPAMASAAGFVLPDSVLSVYGPGSLPALATAGLLIAAVGALLPAARAARLRTAVALRTE
ncbi:hypothetical protein SUDANB171_02256 [Streptomyces sp. enrichment culture]|uniref:ABC transporter permease n=1 Tax=Streptomyces sp. enrichment culture TaxID=1795815 RepID=UPI003F54DEC0